MKGDGGEGRSTQFDRVTLETLALGGDYKPLHEEVDDAIQRLGDLLRDEDLSGKGKIVVSIEMKRDRGTTAIDITTQVAVTAPKSARRRSTAFLSGDGLVTMDGRQGQLPGTGKVRALRAAEAGEAK